MRTWKQSAHLCLTLLYILIVGLWAVAPSARLSIVEVARVVFGLVGVAGAGWAGRGHGPVARAWRAVAGCFVLLAATPPILLVLHAHGITAGDDVTHLAFGVGLLIALHLFPIAATARRDRWRTGLDALTVLVAGGMVFWYVAFGPYLARHGLSGTVLVTAGLYPAGDLALLFTVVRMMLRSGDSSAVRPLRPLAAGAMVLFAGDTVHAYLHEHGRVTMHSPWQFVCWITADALLAAAAIEGDAADRRVSRRPKLRPARLLPFGAIAVFHVLMLIAAVRAHAFYPWGGLAVGGAVLSAIVLVRQILVQRESDRRAVTDELTGLATRRRFKDGSYRALDRGARTGRYTAVLVIDMNGFKQINDSLGHNAGDLVLAGFARLLRRAVPEPGLPARLGGDEFAVVLPGLDSPEDAYEVAGRIAAAVAPMIVDGRLVDVAASIGVAVSAPGELTHDMLVHRADRAMYKAKQFAPDTRWAVWRESFETEPEAEPEAEPELQPGSYAAAA